MAELKAAEQKMNDRRPASPQDFAIYRIPHDDKISLLIGEECERLSDLPSLEGKVGFVAAPFAPDGEHPIVLIRGNIQEIPFPAGAEASVFRQVEEQLAATLPTEEEGSTSQPLISGERKTAYWDHFQTFHQSILAGVFRKIVLSRSAREEKPAGFSSIHTFLKACQAYPDAYIYFFSSQESGRWLGCTPEILLSGSQENWTTVALAGTLLRQETIPHWDDKNIQEQAHVAAYIQDILERNASSWRADGPHTIPAGKLCHLKTTFHFQLPEQETGRIVRILEELHPTPAVCGLPKQEAFHFIQQHEGNDRRWYSGFIGKWDPLEQTDLYVNLRCMEICRNDLILYAGGGLVEGSEVEKEWTETENKMGTLKNLL